MPVYEYVCKGCDHPFEELVLGGETPSCPKCGGSDLEKSFSVFAAGKREEAPAPGSCGTCGDPRGPGACQMN